MTRLHHGDIPLFHLHTYRLYMWKKNHQAYNAAHQAEQSKVGDSVMSINDGQGHWLDQYASSCFAWREHQHDKQTVFYRPLGLVEACFDADGRYYEGRADISLQLRFKVTNRLNKQAYHHHITLAWTCFRILHLMTLASAREWQAWMHKPKQISKKHCFVIGVPRTTQHAIADAQCHVTFLDSETDDVNAKEFYDHTENSSRVLNADQALAHLFVLPTSKHNQTELTFVLVAAHQIGDGVSTGSWTASFVRFMNMNDEALRTFLADSIEPAKIARRLPPAQEALYPPIKGNAARQRWFWVLTIILRHVRKPLQAGFSNPLRRREVHEGALPLQPKFRPALSYDRQPPNSSAPILAQTSRSAMLRLRRLCKEVGASVGAGCFALAAVLMMEFYEKSEAHLALDQRKPFITGFPLNPRPFLVGKPPPESLMLSFSDGILLPFLSSSLDLDGRLRLLARQAQRQLAAYQKRSNIKSNEEGLQYMGSRGAGRLLAIQYIGSIERCDAMRPEELRQNVNPQGAYPMRPNMTRQTCGVSSIGRRLPLNAGVTHDNPDFVIDAISMQPSVRARDGEFLIGIDGGDEGLRAMVSVDGSTMDPDLVEQWQRRFETILDDGNAML